MAWLRSVVTATVLAGCAPAPLTDAQVRSNFERDLRANQAMSGRSPEQWAAAARDPGFSDRGSRLPPGGADPNRNPPIGGLATQRFDSPGAEAHALLLEVSHTGRPLRDVVKERAEQNVGPSSARPSRADREQRRQAIVREELRLLRAIETELAERERSREAQGRLARQQEYCRDLAHNMFVRVAPSDEFFAALILGGSSRQGRYYDDCMASFARTDRYLGR